jgi:hypothetical protein
VTVTVPALGAEAGGVPALCPAGAGWPGVAVKSHWAVPVVAGGVEAVLAVEPPDVVLPAAASVDT